MNDWNKTVLDIQNLSVSFQTKQGDVRAVSDISFQLRQGEILGLVGESGCGKSVTANTIMGLIGRKRHEHITGSIKMDEQELLQMSDRQMSQLRGSQISMVFQDPMTTLNPLLKVGYQVSEGLRIHKKCPRIELKQRTIDMLAQVGIPNPEARYNQFPFSFSGGMRQRASIASALICQPKIVIADEPTTALDVTIQAQILDLLRQMRDSYQASILLITHDLGVVAEICDTVAVMYAGEIVEYGAVADIFQNPRHPYTIGLLRCLPRLGSFQRLEPIHGQPPVITQLDEGCRFRERCPHATEQCEQQPPSYSVGTQHTVSCWRNDCHVL